MTEQLPQTEPGRAALRALGSPHGLVPLIDYLERHGCSKRAVYDRADIPRTLLNGVAFVPINAPAVKGRKRRAK